MQIVIEHWQEVKLKSPAKSVNAPIIQECTGVENYKGREDQRKAMMDKITSENYADMKERVKMLSDCLVWCGHADRRKFLQEGKTGKWKR